MTVFRPTPSQQAVIDRLVAAAPQTPALHLYAGSGLGRTAMLTEIQRRLGGVLVSMRDLLAEVEARHPLALEEALYAAIGAAFEESPRVFFDDWQLLADVVSGCGSYPRSGFLNAIGAACAELLSLDDRRRLVIASDGQLPDHLEQRACTAGLFEFKPDDYLHLCREFHVPAEAALDVAKIHRFAPRLTAIQIRAVCANCERESAWDTETFLEFLRQEHLVSNVDLPEVVPVRFEDLIGMDDMIEQLIANVVFPLENDELAQEYHLRPKRGVLLLGPPGTGKTSIGKALAHRLRGKFFLIDGTVISGTGYFYHHIRHIIKQATDNAPSVVFIDDSDVIFENQQEHGLYRYLLTVLDGLESQSLERVCVILTAMELRHIPPALIRSGRVELWLETRLPDEAARRLLLSRLTSNLPESLRRYDETIVARAAEGTTAADLKRLVNDAKTASAWAQHQGRPRGDFTNDLLDAIRQLKEMKSLYAHVRQSHPARPDRPVWFDVPDAVSA